MENSQLGSELCACEHFAWLQGCTKQGNNKPVWMAVESRRSTVGSPAGVSNASVRVKDLCHVGLALLNELLELGDLANLLESKDLILLVPVDRETSRVVATIFLSCKPIDKNFADGFAVL